MCHIVAKCRICIHPTIWVSLPNEVCCHGIVCRLLMCNKYNEFRPNEVFTLDFAQHILTRSDQQVCFAWCVLKRYCVIQLYRMYYNTCSPELAVDRNNLVHALQQHISHRTRTFLAISCKTKKLNDCQTKGLKMCCEMYKFGIRI